MGMTLKELLTKGEGTLSAQEAKELAAQCRMDRGNALHAPGGARHQDPGQKSRADTSLDVDRHHGRGGKRREQQR